jgi:uncharacterized protein YdiU (UPF0061 family)
MASEKDPFQFENSYERLPGHFHARVRPTPIQAPRLISLNTALCRELGLDPVALSADGAAFFSGNKLPEGAASLAQAYAGHQFGNFVPQLGDGRAILLGEILTPSGARRDIQLKGAGPTPFSRRGDGRAALGPVLREYLVSEAMQALGIPTTRALAAVSTGETIWREEALPGAVFTRVAASHVRVGTFEYFAAKEDDASVEQLALYVMDRHYPECRCAEHPFRALLEKIIERQVSLISRWMQIGFIHGVMNTDNMTVSGETIDYGPCAFMDTYHPQTVFSAIDRGRRYAFSNQPLIAQWNLARLAETLLPFLSPVPEEALEFANARIHEIPSQWKSLWLDGMRGKLGLLKALPEDETLIEKLLAAMQSGEADFTLTFRGLCKAAEDPSGGGEVRLLFKEPESYDAWAAEWKERLALEEESPCKRAAAMRKVNPALIPRNHRVAQALEAAAQGDFSVFERLKTALENPFEESEAFEDLTQPPAPHERVLRTFCGT